ncbi:MAG: hypothetical protein MUO77_19070 [Anaerolineales bacterium]|nr:hypothetical protein [Anaerolineales bacterium]
MNTSDIRENINTKIEQARECERKVFQLCVNYSKTKNPKLLKHMGGYLGTLTNNLRSALNYATADYCQERIKDGIKLSTDFPYSFAKAKFEKMNLVVFMSRSDPDLYNFIEGLQPFNKDTWLGTLMKFSNTDKHKLLVEVQNTDITHIRMWNDKGDVIHPPIHFGSQLLFPASNGNSVVIVPTPCYVERLRMFALPNRTWVNFLIPIEDHFIEFLPYMKNTPKRVEDVIHEFYNKFQY